MKSVCIITQSVYDIDPRVRRKAEALVASGYSVDVLALRAPQGKADYMLAGVHVETTSLGKQRGSLLRYAFEYAAFFLWACARVTVETWRRRYAMIDVNTLPDFLIFAAVFARWMGAKIVLDMHEITPEFYMSKYGIAENSWGVRVIKLLEKTSFDFADHVITISNPVQELLVSRGLDASRATVITNAADDARFSKSTIITLPGNLSSEGKFVMMYHGTLTRIYGLDIAVEAFALVHQEMPGAELWILGAGPESVTLSNLVRKYDLASKVRLVGLVPASSIPGWLAQADIGILPIRCDCFLDLAFPNKLPEFVIMGKTVIVSRLKAIRHYFSEDALAYYQPDNALDLSRQMVRMYQNSELRSQLAQRARREYAPICWNVMKERYLTLVENLTGYRRENVDKTQAAMPQMIANGAEID
jgi:glycosyltransferase involved in cell wall biosynthesis